MDGGRDGITVLISIEPRSYREVIGSAMQALRPHHEIVSVEPCALPQKVLDLEPDLVIADRPNDITRNGRPAWMEYRPYDEAPARVCVGGHERKVQEVDLDILLALVDEVASADVLPGGGC